MSDRLTIEHYVSEAFGKCVQVVLSARIYCPITRSTPDKRASRWFLMELDEVEKWSKDVDPWKKDTTKPLVLEVFVQPKGSRAVVTTRDGSQQATGAGEMVLERWLLRYSSAKAPSSQPGTSNSTRSYLDEASVYKRMIILIRSIYSYARALPAYRMYRTCKRTQGGSFTIGYRMMNSLKQPASGNSRLQTFSFTPIDTPGGQFQVSVEYQPAATVHILEQNSVPASMPAIIPDYIRPQPGAQAVRPPMSASAHEAAAGRTVTDGGSSPPVQAGRGIQRQSWSSKQMRISLPAPASSAREYRRTVSGELAAASPQSGAGAPNSSAGASPTSLSPFASSQPRPIPQPYVSNSPHHQAEPHAEPSALPQHQLDMHDMPLVEGAGTSHSVAGTSSPSTAPHTAATQHMSTLPPSHAGSYHSHAKPPLPSTPSHAHKSRNGVLAQQGAEAAGSPSHSHRLMCTSPQQQQQLIAIASAGSSQPGSHSSQAVPIPIKSSRTRSHTDLYAVYDFQVDPQTAAMVAAHHSLPTTSAQRLAPASAPAAPRGMLGLALHAQKRHGAATGAVADSSNIASGAASTALVPYMPVQNLTAQAGMEPSSVGGQVTLSASPQLPFAFTPSGQSLASLHQAMTQHILQRSVSQNSQAHAAVQPSPAVSGRDITALATIRRPSWSSRSSSYDVATGAPQLSTSSPLHDLLESSLSVSTSTPRQIFSFSPLSSPANVARGQVPGSVGGSPGNMLLAKQTSTVGENTELPLLPEESDSDLLPFALDTDTDPAPGSSGGTGIHAHSASSAAGTMLGQHGTAAWGMASRLQTQLSHKQQQHEHDVAVGAFIQMLNEAPQLSLDESHVGNAPTTAGQAAEELTFLTRKIQAFLATAS